MNVSRSMMIAALSVIALIGASAPVVRAEYKFTVHNNTKHTIVSLVAAENGQRSGEFDVGDGIAPGKSAVLVWDKSTEDSHCEWAFSAVYDDGTFSEPVVINFCEDELELVFDE